MTTFNELINSDISDLNNNDIEQSNESNDTNDTQTQTGELILFNNLNKLETLITIDENIPVDKLPYEGIHYLDSSKLYSPRKPMGQYTMKLHQLTSLYYMRGLENMIYNVKTIKKNIATPHDTIPHLTEPSSEITTNYTNIGVLCDHVGAGKSYCIMALLNEAKTLNGKNIPFRCKNVGSSNITPLEVNKLDTNILLVPHSLIGQWSKYLENSGLKYHVVQKAKDVFTLGDDKCRFKTIPTKDEKKTDDVKPKSRAKKASSKATTKAATAEAAATTPNDDTAAETEITTSKSKKKIVLKKKSNDEAIPEPVTQPVTQPVIEEVVIPIEPVAPVIPSLTKKQLEDKKKEINRSIAISRTELYDLRYRSRHNIRETTTDEEIGAYIKKIDELEKVITNFNIEYAKINDSIMECELINGTISPVNMQSLNHCYATLKYNDKYYNAMDNYLKGFNRNLSHLNKPFVESLDVILVSDTFYNLLSLYFNKDSYTVNRIIIDECNSIKGSGLIDIKTVFTWLITSSISSLMTNNGYVCKRQLSNEGYAYQMREKTVFSTGFIFNTISALYDNDNFKLFLINNPEHIKQSILLPEMEIFIIVCKDNAIIQVLNGMVSNDIMRMLNAGDIEGIIGRIDAVVGDENNIIKLITQKYHDELLIKEYELKVTIENPKYKADVENISVINKKFVIQELKTKIACIEDRIKSVDNCPICIDDFTNPIITPCCNNKYCFTCITMALNDKTKCPTCRSELTISKLLVVKDGKNSNTKTNDEIVIGFPKELTTYGQKSDYVKANSNKFNKYENMDKIFELNNDLPVKKYLIFTEYESTLNIKITSILDKWSLKYDRIRGTSATINRQLEKYKAKNGETNVLLVNSKFFGSGMNLENTTDIIILHKMNSDIEMQAIGRAQRYGRQGNLRVWKLYYQNEIA